MAGIYGVLGVADTERIFLNTLGQSTVYNAINEYMAMHNAELAATLGVFVGETTNDFKKRYARKNIANAMPEYSIMWPATISLSPST